MKMMKRKMIEENVKTSRTGWALVFVFALRVVTFVSSLILIFSGWLFIIGSFWYEDDIRGVLSGVPILGNAVVNFLEPITLVLIDELIPKIVAIMSSLEMWTNITTVLNQEVWRTYLT